MNKLIFLLLCILCFSCGNNSKSKKTVCDLQPEDSIIVEDKLHPTLVEGVLNLIDYGFHLEFPDIPLSESFIAIFFAEEFWTVKIYPADYDVVIFYNNFRSYDGAQKYYKGILNIEGYNVAIFDMTASGIGYEFFNADSLMQIPLEEFKPFLNFTEEFYTGARILYYIMPDRTLMCVRCDNGVNGVMRSIGKW